MVPAYLLDKVWREGNFLIPADKGLRRELRQKLERALLDNEMYSSKHSESRAVLSARVAALYAYDFETGKFNFPSPKTTSETKAA